MQRRFRHSTWLWAAIAAVAWASRYQLRFGLRRTPPWSDWYDQTLYLRSAAAFAHGNLSAAEHWYPLGYPLLASPLVKLTPAAPFLLVDMALYAAACTGFQRAMRSIGVGQAIAGVAFLLSTLAQMKVARCWLPPWTTTLSAALIWWAIALTAELLNSRPGNDRVTPRQLFLIGLLLGALPAVRPMDVFLSIPLAIATVFFLGRRRLLDRRAAAAIGSGFLLVAPPYFALHLAIYGPNLTEYMVQSTRRGFIWHDLGWKAYTLLITPSPWYPDTQSICEALPWTLPGVAGLLAAVCGPGGERRTLIAMMLALVLIYVVPFLAFEDLQAHGLWRFNNAHYFKWLFPLLAVGVLFWFESFASRKGAVAGGASLAALMLVACIRITPISARPDQAARLLRFADGAIGEGEAIDRDPILIDAKGAMIRVYDYHHPAGAGEPRVIAGRRLIEPDARLFRLGRPPLAPTDRYAERISFGRPCWFARQACAAGTGL